MSLSGQEADRAGAGLIPEWLASAGFRELDIRLYDRRTNRRLAGLLVDGQGRPWGPLAVKNTPIFLPTGFHGYALVEGYIPGAVQALPQGKFCFVDLRPAAFVRGHLVASVREAGKLFFYDLEPGHAGPAHHAVDVAKVAKDGTFSLGPITAGQKQLRFVGPHAWLGNSWRHVTLHPGPQDLGDILLQPLSALYLRLQAEPGVIGQKVFVAMRFEGQDPSLGLGAWEQTVEDQSLEIPQVREGPLHLGVWTAGGWLGEIDGVLARDTSPGSPAVISLRPPGSLVIDVSLQPRLLPAGSVILVYPLPHDLDRLRLSMTEGQRPADRVRRVTASARVKIEHLWSGPVALALLSAQGAVLARRSVTVFPARPTFVTLRPRKALAALEVTNSHRHGSIRIAVVSELVGLMLRGSVRPASTARFLLPPGEYRVVELATGPRSSSSRTLAEALRLEAGRVAALR